MRQVAIRIILFAAQLGKFSQLGVRSWKRWKEIRIAG